MDDITRAMIWRDVEDWTNHRLITSKIRFCFKRPRRAQHKIPTPLAYVNLIHLEVYDPLKLSTIVRYDNT